MFPPNRRILALAPALALAVLSLLAVSPAIADMYGNVNIYPSGWPNYFSGTNCSVIGTVGAGSPAWLAEAHMFIDGTEVRTYTDNGQHAPYVVWSGVMFDSSHVSDGNNHDFHLTGRNSLGQTLDYHRYCQAYNEAYVLGNSTLTQTAQAIQDVSQQTGAMNHGTVSSQNATRAQIIANIPLYTVFYIYTHGQAGGGAFMDCPNAAWVTSGDVSGAVANKTAAQPPYNFVHIDACWSSASSALASAFGVTGPPPYDRAFLGWYTHVMDDAACEQWTMRLWTNLQAGQVLNDAATNADQGGHADANVVGDGAAQWKYYGDGCMTLHATYYLGATGQWHN